MYVPSFEFCGGAFSRGVVQSDNKNYLSEVTSGNANKWCEMLLNANNSSQIYGNSTYVQPKSVSVLPILKY